MPRPLYKSEQVEAWWDVPVYADHLKVRANRVDARVVNHESKKVMTTEMSCPWISNQEKKSEEKTMKYGPLRWELKEQYKGYEEAAGRKRQRLVCDHWLGERLLKSKRECSRWFYRRR